MHRDRTPESAPSPPPSCGLCISITLHCDWVFGARMPRVLPIARFCVSALRCRSRPIERAVTVPPHLDRALERSEGVFEERSQLVRSKLVKSTYDLQIIDVHRLFPG